MANTKANQNTPLAAPDFIEQLTNTDSKPDSPGYIRKQEIYKTADEAATRVLTDMPLLHKILELSARTPAVKITNLLNMAVKRPDAIHMNTKRGWNKRGVRVIDESGGIDLLEASQTPKYDPATGQTSRPNYAATFYDVIDTNAYMGKPAPVLDIDRMFATIQQPSRYKIEFMEGVPGGCLFFPQRQTMYIDKALTKEQTVCAYVGGMVQKDLHYELKLPAGDPQLMFASQCAAYITAVKTGQTVSQYAINKADVPQVEPEIMKKLIENIHRSTSKQMAPLTKEHDKVPDREVAL